MIRNSLLDPLLRNTDRRDTIVHLGPGILYDSIDYAAPAARLVIVEPMAERILALEALRGVRSDVEIIARVAAESAGSAELHYYNFATLNGLLGPDALRPLFPGLQETQTPTVDTLAVGCLVNSLEADHRQRDVLIIDALGEGLSLLRAFDAASALSRFSHIVVRTSHRPLLPGAVSSDLVLEWLESHHFDRPLRLDDVDPDFPIFCCSKNVRSEELASQKTLTQALRADLALQEKSRDEIERERDKLTLAVAAAEREAEQIQKDLQLSLRTQNAVRRDLEDLRDQFARVRQEKDEVDRLLREVAAQLGGLPGTLRRAAYHLEPDAATPSPPGSRINKESGQEAD